MGFTARSPLLPAALVAALATTALPAAAATPAATIATAPAATLANAPSRYAVSDGLRVHYKSLGKGRKAVVLVHGWTCDMSVWAAQVAALAGRVRVVVLDLPGHGGSDKPAVDYTMDRFAAAIEAVLKDAGVRRAVLVGHSMGTPVVRQFYRRDPERTLGLVAVDGALRRLISDPEQIRGFVGRFEGPGYADAVGGMMDAMFTQAAPPGAREAVRAVAVATPQAVAVSAMKGMLDLSIWGDDPIRVPLLVVNAKSPMWSAEYEAYVRSLDPQVEFHTIEGAGHFLMMEKPAEFDRLLDGFLARLGLMKP